MKLSAGIRFMLLATLTFTFMKVFVKLIPHIPPIEIILFRSIVSLLISLFFLLRQRVPVFGNNKPLLIGRGVTGAIALTLNYYLLQEIPLATASTLTYLAPIFTAIFGIYIVRERVFPLQFLFFAVSFLGILVIRGFDTRISMYHLAIGLGASFFMGLAYNFVRKLNTTEHPLVIIFYFPLVLLPLSAGWSYFNWVQPTGLDWLYLLLVGITTQIAQFFMTKSYQLAEVNKVSILNYVGIIYSLILGFLIFDETFNLLTYLGMGLVLIGVMANVIYRRNR